MEYEYLTRFLTNFLANEQKNVEQLSEFLSALSSSTSPRANNVETWQHPDGTLIKIVRDESGFGLVERVQGGDAEIQLASYSHQPEIVEEENMKYISKRKDGRWMGSKLVDGKRIYVYAHTQRECAVKLKEALKTNTRDNLSGQKGWSLFKFANWWLETYKKNVLKKYTYRCYEYQIKVHLNVATPLRKLTLVELQVLLNNLPATRVRKEVAMILRQILRKAYELELVKRDFSEFLVIGKIQEGSRDALTLEQQEKLLHSLSDDMFSQRIIVYLCTGVRPSELKSIKKSELRPGWVKINGTKNGYSTRWVKISTRVYEILRDAPPEFFSYDLKRFREKFQNFCIEHEICDEIDLYTLRHTFATNLYILRVPEKDRQMYMGHSAGSVITNKTYTTFSPDVTAQNIKDIYGDLYPEF